MNTLDFVMFDPVEAGEEWAVDFDSSHKVIECMIDSRPLIDIIHEYEAKQKDTIDGLELRTRSSKLAIWRPAKRQKARYVFYKRRGVPVRMQQLRRAWM